MRWLSKIKFVLAAFGLVGALFLLLVVYENAGYQPSAEDSRQPLSKPSENAVSFLVFGDSGTGSFEQKELAKTMLMVPFDFLLHTGDVAYPEGTLEQLQENFHAVYKEHLMRGQIYPSPGNHDYQTEDLAPYLKFFDLPKQALREEDEERYYSFDVQNIHFVALDTNRPLEEVSDQATDDMADWLKEDLQGAHDQEWRLVFFHHAPYSSDSDHGGDVRAQRTLVPIFEMFNVDVVFSGHVHTYERTCRLYGGSCSLDKGVTYIITGGGGAALHRFGPEKDFTVTRSQKHHFVYATIIGCRFDAKVIGINGETIDDFYVDKCGAPQ